ncbi:riboflavin synthase [Sulfobacillus harzensis]|uniref:Riboflavin synthase n=1 Tax=Sulfobacillus harzensis TaxID=2729629 RepID=A0A7Y0Q223_9FIRM|nr:riboflavin synthase [Sulfobacillus harzensis]NMP21466.1 riboflavin synthase [Sulfobacillus harzensis]
MFTGLIESIGRLRANTVQNDGISRRLIIETSLAAHLDLGESIAVNGVCLTVVEQDETAFEVDVSPTTLNLTTLGHLTPGSRVNLERALTPATRLGGHWVLGHVDTRGTVRSIREEGDAHHIEVAYPPRYAGWVLPQGSITFDGVSLTIVARSDDWVKVTIIPHTWEHTTIGDWIVNASVNIEFDVLGKYVEHLLAPYSGRKEERP